MYSCDPATFTEGVLLGAFCVIFAFAVLEIVHKKKGGR